MSYGTPPPPTDPPEGPGQTPQDHTANPGGYGPPAPAPQYGQAPPPSAPQYGQAPPPAYGQAPAYGQGAPGYGQPAGPAPKNYLVWACITILFCWPLAIPAIIFANQVNSKWAAGDTVGAAASSNKAKMFAIVGTILGVIILIINIAVRMGSSTT